VRTSHPGGPPEKERSLPNSVPPKFFACGHVDQAIQANISGFAAWASLPGLADLVVSSSGEGI
jgi:hypothetical protein